MSTLSNKLVAACMVTAISMVMYGCGGGGGSSSDDEMTMMPPPTTPEPPTCAEGEVLQDGACVTAPPTAEELTKRADTKRKAIAAEAAQTTDAGLGGSNADGTAVDTYSMTIKRGRDGTTVEIADTAQAGDDDPKFAQAMDLGGGTTMHVRTMEADSDGDVVSEVVMVSTDIEAPKAVPFAMWEAMDGTTPQALNVASDTGVAAVSPATDVL